MAEKPEAVHLKQYSTVVRCPLAFHSDDCLDVIGNFF